MSHYTNPHYLYLFSSIATQKQVYDYTIECIKKLEEVLGESLSHKISVNTITKYDGTPLKHSYVWLKSVEVANLLLNKNKDGSERVEECIDPTHDTSEAESKLSEFFNSPVPDGVSWVDVIEEEEILVSATMKRMIKKEMDPLVKFGTIELSEEQKLKYPDMKQIEITFYPVKIHSKPGLSHNKLYAQFVPKDVTEQDLRSHFERYVSEKTTFRSFQGHQGVRDKKNYPIIHFERRNNPSSVMVIYHPLSTDAIFASLMLKKFVIPDKCTLNFELFRDS
jgi:hypothetical protein